MYTLNHGYSVGSLILPERGESLASELPNLTLKLDVYFYFCQMCIPCYGIVGEPLFPVYVILNINYQ